MYEIKETEENGWKKRWSERISKPLWGVSSDVFFQNSN